MGLEDAVTIDWEFIYEPTARAVLPSSIPWIDAAARRMSKQFNKRFRLSRVILPDLRYSLIAGSAVQLRSSKNTEAFVQLMTAHQGRLYGYILSLLGDVDQANDVLQESNVVLWRNAAEFRPGSNFRAWAFRIAHFQVMAHRQRQLRDRVIFDDEILAVLDPAAREEDETFEARELALAGCLEKLGEPHRDLLHKRYALGQSLQAIADVCQKSANGVAQTLFRIRRSLIECVARSSAAGGS